MNRPALKTRRQARYMLNWSADPDSIPQVLLELNDRQVEAIRRTFLEDEACSDDAAMTYLTEICGLSDDAARAAIGFRSTHLINPFFELRPRAVASPRERTGQRPSA